MANAFSMVKNLTVGQIAAFIQKIGGPKAVERVLRDEGLAETVATIIALNADHEQWNDFGYVISTLGRAAQEIADGHPSDDLIVGGAKKATCSFADLIPDGWTVVEDVAPSTFDIAKLKPVSFLKPGESSIGGDEMRKRAIEFKGNLGLADGKRMLAEQDKIPAEFRKFYIPLPGTVLRDSGGNLYVPYLYFHGGRWVLDFDWLGIDWGGHDRFACCE